ncbi:hypothetical protein, partial [Klebsiella pneumoniae]|uniref:hypothetical protein n=1 Tax=Klebsiella pneumoniae TaxID=573 RepID=UPI0019551EE4
VGCLVGHLFMFLVGGKTPDQSVHLNLTTTPDSDAHFPRQMMRNLGFFPVLTAHTQRGTEDEPGFQQIVYRRW